MNFRITGLPLSLFQPLFGLTDADLAACGARRYIADQKPGFPCRISLMDAEPGETLILLNYQHQPANTPYQSAHAVFVREAATQQYDRVGEVPQQLRTRLLSVRSFDRDGMMVDADVTEGRDLEILAQRLFDKPEADYLHVHTARRGCYLARIDRI